MTSKKTNKTEKPVNEENSHYLARIVSAICVLVGLIYLFINFNDYFDIGIDKIILNIITWVAYNFSPTTSSINFIVDLIIITTLIIGYSDERKDLISFSYTLLILNIINPFNMLLIGGISTSRILTFPFTGKLWWEIFNALLLLLVSLFISKIWNSIEIKRKNKKQNDK